MNEKQVDKLQCRLRVRFSNFSSTDKVTGFNCRSSPGGEDLAMIGVYKDKNERSGGGFKRVGSSDQGRAGKMPALPGKVTLGDEGGPWSPRARRRVSYG